MRVFAATTIILPVLESTTYESSRRMILSTHVKVVKQTTTRPVVLYPDKYHGTAEQHLPLITVNVATHRDETNKPETKIHASYHHHRNKTEYVIKAIIFALFGIAVVLLLTIFYVYIRQKMHEARSF